VRWKGRVALAICCWTPAFCGYTQPHASEYAVKAAYLFNFGKFVRFAPSDAVNDRRSFDICIVGNDPLGSTLDDLTANEHLDSKPVRVLRVKVASDARTCAIAYISAAEGNRLDADLEALRGHEVLTVSDVPEFLQHGGMVQFVTAEKHVRFAVNLDAVRKAQISLSSELLKVASSVTGNASEGGLP